MNKKSEKKYKLKSKLNNEIHLKETNNLTLNLKERNPNLKEKEQ